MQSRMGSKQGETTFLSGAHQGCQDSPIWTVIVDWILSKDSKLGIRQKK